MKSDHLNRQASAARHLPLWLPVVLLGLLTAVLYWPATHHGFINYDDGPYVTQNIHVQNGLTLGGLKWAFGSSVTGNWHPLTMISHMVDCQLFGLNPRGHHLTSLLLNALNTALLFLLLNRLTGAVWRSAFAAALFGCHPANVESVAWVAERKSVLSLGFGLLALLCYTRYAQGRARQKRRTLAFDIQWWADTRIFCGSSAYWLAWGFLAAGLMSKPVLVTWPLVMLLLDYWPLNRFASFGVRWLVWEKIPFVALVAIISGITMITHNQAGDIIALDDKPLPLRLENILISYCRYLGKVLWPEHLCILYTHSGYWPAAWVALGGLFLAGVSLLFWMGRQRYPFLLMGWGWFLVTLVPVIGLVQVGEQVMADRHLYIPAIGLLIAVIWGACELTGSWRYQAPMLVIVGLTTLILCFAATRQQLAYWQDSETVFRRALVFSDGSFTVHNRLGAALLNEGHAEEAMTQFHDALRLYPRDAEAANNLGVALMRQGRLGEAMDEFTAALHIETNYTEAHFNLGVACLNTNKLDQAIAHFQTAARLAPDDAATHFELGQAFARQHRVDEEISQYQEAIRLKPAYAEAHYYLGTALLDKGDLDGAADQFKEASQFDPNYAPAHNNLGIVLVRESRIDDAISEFQEALRLQPDYPRAQGNLEKVLALKNKQGGGASKPGN